MHQKFSLGSNGVVRVRSLRKIPMRVRGTNFYTSSARFVPSFVRQPNGPECTQIVRNAPKCQFRVQWGGSGAFDAKNSDATSWHKLLHCLARFAPNSVRQPNGPKCAQIKRNVKKHQFTVQWGGSGVFLEKIPTQLCGTNFCTSSARFAPSFVRQPNGPQCSQIEQNAPKTSVLGPIW